MVLTLGLCVWYWSQNKLQLVPYTTSNLSFITEAESVYSAVRTESLYETGYIAYLTVKWISINVIKNLNCENSLTHIRWEWRCPMRRGEWTDVMKLVVAFRSCFANAPKAYPGIFVQNSCFLLPRDNPWQENPGQILFTQRTAISL